MPIEDMEGLVSSSIKKIYSVSHHEHLVPDLDVNRPEAGILVPSESRITS